MFVRKREYVHTCTDDAHGCRLEINKSARSWLVAHVIVQIRGGILHGEYIAVCVHVVNTIEERELDMKHIIIVCVITDHQHLDENRGRQMDGEFAERFEWIE